ncbi:methyl-accepting chemotaxis protein [Aquabacterium sp. A7-Y]|uniref:methyl-accepting chemotaxis protein n=1 Tax=Aquabacterium sp. A7-Y TaxID=1349605 RepID=UPI002AC80FDB|nr:methyl-accepting chemotaxis protein [Aquabacterium sp. A7-Y]
MSFLKLNQLSIGRRLALGFASVILMLVGVAAMNSAEFRSIAERLRETKEVNDPKTALAHEMLNQINVLAVQARSITLIIDVKELDAEVAVLRRAQAAYVKAEQALAERIQASGSESERRLMQALRESSKDTLPLVLRAAKEGEDGASAAATATLLNEVRPREAVWRNKVAELIALEAELNQQAYQSALDSRQRAQTVAGLVVVLAVLAGSFLAWGITRSVKAPVDRAIRIAERIAKGDLSSSVQVQSADEIGRLLAAIASMQDQLRGLVGEIRQSADNIDLASAEVAGGNRDLSARTEEAASSLQLTASSMQQLTATVRQNADAASQANQLALSASAVAKRGGEVVDRVVSTMDAIDTSSKRISDIIGVIDGIAFQTNILALNAAVESARAGEQGRGFAVVAGEVRSLAQRSADAAREIKVLIGSSVEQVESGSRLVQDAGSTMSEIVGSVQRVADIIAEITAGSSEQSGGIGQVNHSVNQLEQMTQQNAALVEESAASAASLREQAARLAALVSTFRLQEEPAKAGA